MKAIETEYKGYRFRSRLEARWAVFFDQLGILYEYEPEGIVLSDGTHYLPDFYLPEFHCYFEVKRKGIQNTPEGREAIRKIRNGADTNEWAGIIAFGDPIDDRLRIFCQETDDEGGGGYSGRVTFGNHPYHFVPYLFVGGDFREKTFYDSFGKDMKKIPMTTTRGGYFSCKDFVDELVIDARNTARQARFEYGETPALPEWRCR
jgi:hypothetical protein